MTLGHRGRDRRPQRVLEAQQADELERQVVVLLGEIPPAGHSPRNAQDAQALGREDRHLKGHRFTRRLRQVA